jgi:hypothetical protein
MISITLFFSPVYFFISTFSFYFPLRSSLKKKGKVVCIERTIGLNTYSLFYLYNVTSSLTFFRYFHRRVQYNENTIFPQYWKALQNSITISLGSILDAKSFVDCCSIL